MLAWPQCNDAASIDQTVHIFKRDDCLNPKRTLTNQEERDPQPNRKMSQRYKKIHTQEKCKVPIKSCRDAETCQQWQYYKLLRQDRYYFPGRRTHLGVKFAQTF